MMYLSPFILQLLLSYKGSERCLSFSVGFDVRKSKIGQSQYKAYMNTRTHGRNVSMSLHYAGEGIRAESFRGSYLD